MDQDSNESQFGAWNGKFWKSITTKKGTHFQIKNVVFKDKNIKNFKASKRKY